MEIEIDQAASSDAEAAQSVPARRWSGRVVAATAAVMVLSGGLWWCTHPGGFPNSAGVGTTGAEGVVGKTWAFEAGVYPAAGVDATYVATVDAMTPIVAENTAAADISVMRCTLIGPGRLGAATLSDLPNICATVDDPTAGSTSFGPATEMLVIVTTHQPGHVLIKGVDLSYHHGIRSGTAHLGGDITVSAR